MNVSEVLRHAEAGTHPSCRRCPWHPRRNPDVAFGTSCVLHGANWKAGSEVVSVQIVRDPAGTTPQDTGTLCFVCNSENPSDRTAQNAFALWNAAVALGADSGEEYLGAHYWTNAMLHGSSGSSASAAEEARRSCSGVLRDQLEALRPNVIIANGEDAAKSLLELGIIRRRWTELRGSFDAGAYREVGRLPSGHRVTSFVSYHTSARSVNQTVANLYTPAAEDRLARKLGKLLSPGAAAEFLEESDPCTTTGRGLRMLLLHWLDIGEAVRAAHGAPAGGAGH